MVIAHTASGAASPSWAQGRPAFLLGVRHQGFWFDNDLNRMACLEAEWPIRSLLEDFVKIDFDLILKNCRDPVILLKVGRVTYLVVVDGGGPRGGCAQCAI